MTIAILILAVLTDEWIVDDSRICLYRYDGYLYSLFLNVDEHCPDNMEI